MSTEQRDNEPDPSIESIADSFSGQQLRRGLVLLVAFIGMRAILWGPFWSQPTLDDPIQYGALILVSVLVGSVGLVYLGFTRWVGVDIVAWWIDRDHVLRDLLWGIVGFILALLVMLELTLGLQSTFGPPQDAPVAEAPSLVGTLLLYAFGFAVAAFQEETLFRGFLQTAIGHRFGGVASGCHPSRCVFTRTCGVLPAYCVVPVPDRVRRRPCVWLASEATRPALSPGHRARPDRVRVTSPTLIFRGTGSDQISTDVTGGIWLLLVRGIVNQ